MRYKCYVCENEHSTDNVCSVCIQCHHKITERFALEMSKKDAAIRKLEDEVETLTAESEGRRKALSEVADKHVREWKRAEQAEAALSFAREAREKVEARLEGVELRAASNFEDYEVEKSKRVAAEYLLATYTKPFADGEVEDLLVKPGESVRYCGNANCMKSAGRISSLSLALRQARAEMEEANSRQVVPLPAWEATRRDLGNALARLADVLDFARHTHEGRYRIDDEGKGHLTDACRRCGLDIRHIIHSQAIPAQGDKK